MSGAGVIFESFRLHDGSLVRADLHRARFHAATGLGSQFDTLVRSLPTQGDWFPRVHAGGVDVRACPPVRDTAVVVSRPAPPRTAPHLKGPDVGPLLALRAASGADEAVLLDDDHIVEGCTSTVVWWRDDTLHVVASTRRLASVTEQVVVELAGSSGVPVRAGDARPSDLEGCEMWLLNALHGIRVVEEWVDGPVVGAAVRAPSWRLRYEALRRPISVRP